uniref:Uncharacterized protein n=1 Tax=Gouania willdenowi TaxID=441366 RepID=A0A8C5EY99_GOUWI
MFAFAVVSVGHVEYQLQGPEAGVGHGVVVVVAHVLTAGLTRVAVKVLLLIAPHLLTSHQEHQQSEDEDDGQPDTAEGCGVLVDPTEEALQEAPVHLLLITILSRSLFCNIMSLCGFNCN